MTYDRKHIKHSRSKFLAYAAAYKRCLFDNSTGGYIVYHESHGAMELTQNLAIARILASHGLGVELLPAVKHARFPDARVNGKYWEFKTIGHASQNISNAIQNHFQRAIGQSPCIVLHIDQRFSIESLFQGIEYGLKADKDRYFERVMVVLGAGIAEFSVTQVRSGKYKKKLVRLIETNKAL